jgi:hypothetical protein
MCDWRVKPTSSRSSVCRSSAKCGNLDVSQPYGLPRPITGTSLLYFFLSDSRISKKNGKNKEKEVISALRSRTTESMQWRKRLTFKPSRQLGTARVQARIVRRTQRRCLQYYSETSTAKMYLLSEDRASLSMRKIIRSMTPRVWQIVSGFGGLIMAYCVSPWWWTSTGHLME